MNGRLSCTGFWKQGWPAPKKPATQDELDAELTSYMLKGKPEVAKEALDTEMEAYWAKKSASEAAAAPAAEEAATA